jgi:hypothetical protein
MNDYGLVISEAGYDADTCAPENTIFDTRFDTPKALVSDTFNSVAAVTFIFSTTPPVGTTRLFTVKHPLGYTPVHLSYYDAERSSTPYGVIGRVSGRYYVTPGPFNLGHIVVKANATELYFDFERQPDPGGGFPAPNMVGITLTFKYYIFCNDSK